MFEEYCLIDTFQTTAFCSLEALLSVLIILRHSTSLVQREI